MPVVPVSLFARRLTITRRFGLVFSLVASTAAGAIIGLPIPASEQGWVCTSPSPSALCPGNNGASPNNVYIAGFVQGLDSQFRDWFEFAIPVLPPAPFASASLFLTESASGHVGGPLTYSVYGLSTRPLAFSDVTTSNLFGSIDTVAADNGLTLEIPLNAAAFTQILAQQGGNIFIGGIDSGELSATDARDFGAPSAVPAELIIIEADQTVPEPNLTLPLAIMFATGIVIERRRGHRLRSEKKV